MKKLALFGGEKVREKPFPPFPVLSQGEAEAVKEVLKTNRLSGFIAAAGENFLGGPKVKELEEKISKYFNIKYAVAVNSGTAGLHCALVALNLKLGDEVIVPPYTMSATATAVLMAGATPVFSDVDENNFCINPAEIERNITPHTKAIVVVHLFGYPAQMDEIKKIAKEHNLAIIEDCAQAPGAVYKNRLVGTMGDIGVFSFNQHKTITTGEGGFTVTNSQELALRMQLVRNHGEAVVENMGLDENFAHIIGYNYRMTELEAAIGITQFLKLEQLNQHRIRLAEYLTKSLSQIGGLILPSVENNRKHVYFLLPIKVDSSKLGVGRDRLVDALVAEGIPFGKGYVKPLYLLPIYQKRQDSQRYKEGICPVAEKLHYRELIYSSPALLRYPMTEKDMNDVVTAFKKIVKNKNEFEVGSLC